MGERTGRVMWWLDDTTTRFRATAVRERSATDTRLPISPVLPKPAKLLDELTDTQRAANLALCETHDEYEVEIDRLVRNVSSLETALRQRSATVSELTASIDLANHQQLHDTRRFADFITGYEKLVASRDSDCASLESAMRAAEVVASEQFTQARNEFDSKSRRQRSIAEAAEIAAAVKAEQHRREHDRELRRLREQATESERTHVELNDRLQESERAHKETESSMQFQQNELRADRSGLQIELSVLRARLECKEAEICGLARQSADSSAANIVSAAETAIERELWQIRFEMLDALVAQWEREAYRQRAGRESNHRKLVDLQTLSEQQSCREEKSSLEIDDLQRSLSESHELLLLVTSEADQTGEELRASSDLADRLQSSLDQCRVELVGLSRDCQTAINESDDRLRVCEQLRRSLAQTQENLDFAQRELSIARAEYADALVRSESVTDQLHRSEVTVLQMSDHEKRSVEVQESQRKSFQARVDELEQFTGGMQNTIDELTDALDQERNQRVVNEDGFRQANAEQARHLAKLTKHRNDLLSELVQIRDQRESLIGELERLRAVVEKSETRDLEIAKLKAQLCAGKARGTLLIQRYRDRIKVLESRLQRYHQETQGLNPSLPRRAA